MARLESSQWALGQRDLLLVRPRQFLPLVAGLTLLAFALRVLRLDFVNFTSDEAFFVQLSYQGTFRASMSIDEPHPPLFLALLQPWMGLAGASQYAIRFLPVLYGTLLVPVTDQLGRVLTPLPDPRASWSRR